MLGWRAQVGAIRNGGSEPQVKSLPCSSKAEGVTLELAAEGDHRAGDPFTSTEEHLLLTLRLGL
jgi:hypothetical protein